MIEIIISIEHINFYELLFRNIATQCFLRSLEISAYPEKSKKEPSKNFRPLFSAGSSATKVSLSGITCLGSGSPEFECLKKLHF